MLPTTILTVLCLALTFGKGKFVIPLKTSCSFVLYYYASMCMQTYVLRLASYSCKVICVYYALNSILEYIYIHNCTDLHTQVPA